MRISIWQQFGSNHSASYTVVGKFADLASANNAQEELNKILERLKIWWTQQLTDTDSQEWQNLVEVGGLTPLEEEFSRHYDVEWKGINWYYWLAATELQEPVVTFKEFVFVRSPHYYIWYGPQPFDGLLKRLGGEVWIESDVSQSYPDTDLNILIICDAPNETTAQQIEEECLSYMRTVNSETEVGIPPWITC